MGTGLSNRRQRDQERRDALWQIAAADVTRHLIRAAADEVDRAAVWAHLAEFCREQADAWAERAVEGGASYAEVADALGMSRQGARKRYRHLTVVS